jgi:beta-lactamase regulating signal transducer with metallopeptidase domain
MPHISFPIAIDAALKATVILATAAAGATLLRRASASARHLVWTLGLTGALAVPLLAIVTPRWELPVVRVAAAPAAQLAVERMPAAIPAPSRAIGRVDDGSLDDTSETSSIAARSSPLAPRSKGAVWPSVSWLSLLYLVWAAGASVILGRMLLGLGAVQWMSRRMATVTDAPWLGRARALAQSLGLRHVRFLRSSERSMPMAWGVFRSSVLIPADAEAWPDERLRIVLLHELAHVKRRDCLTHLVAQGACAINWFNPLVWMAARRLRAEREHACDDLVLEAGTRGSDYANQLLDLARVMRAGRFPGVLASATLAMAHRSQLEGRLIAILDPTVSRRGLTRVRAWGGALVFALLIVPITAVQPWAMEPAAIKGPIDQNLPTARQAAKPADKPAATAAAPVDDPVVREEPSADQQGEVQGGVSGGVRGGVHGKVAGGVDHAGIPGGVTDGITEGVRQGVGVGVSTGVGVGISTGVGVGISTGVGVGAAVANSVVTSVAPSVVNGMMTGIAQATIASQDVRRQNGRAVDPRALDALVQALKDTDKDVREAAMQALVQFRDPRVFDPMVAALKDSSADTREKAAFALGQLRDARAVDPLAAALHDTSSDVREQAAFALGQIRNSKAVDPLIPALKDTKPDVREQAAFALGQIRDPRAVDALVIALKDSVPDVRGQAAFALGQIRDPRAIEGLAMALKDTVADVRRQAAFALGQIR